MQCPALLAFRKRLSKRGYTDIHIRQAFDVDGKIKPDRYVVTAVEPLSKTVVFVEHSVTHLRNMFR